MWVRWCQTARVSVAQRNDLVTALRAVPGVADVELLHAPEPGAGQPGVDQAGENGTDPSDAGTLRLSLEPGADEVAVATRVNQLLRHEFGLGVDAGRVQLLEEAEPARPLRAVPAADGIGRLAAGTATAELAMVASGGRMLIQRMQLVSAAPGVTAAVTLAVGGHAVVGEADGAASPGSVHRSVAEATLRAVEAVADGRARFHLERVEVAPLGDDQVVLCVVSMTSAGGTDRLIGTSAVREDVRQAVIRATLDAINRRLEAVLDPSA